MTNLSYFGCHLLTDVHFDLSEVITLAMPRMQDLRAQVRWVNDGQAGVRFLHGILADDGQTNSRSLNEGLTCGSVGEAAGARTTRSTLGAENAELLAPKIRRGSRVSATLPIHG